MIHLPLHIGSHQTPHPVSQIPVRPAAAIAVGVLVINVVVIWLALGLRSAPATDAAQIEALVHRQIAALNDRDPVALQLTYCTGTGPVGARIIDALGPASPGSTIHVSQITDIQFIGSMPADLATARITLTVSGTGNEALAFPPRALSYFEREETGWKMCHHGGQPQFDRYL